MGWATISDQQVDPESPVTSSLVIALRDNPIAIANADAGAPRNKLSSLAEPPVKMFESVNGQNSLTINPFTTTPANTMLLLISVQCAFVGESGSLDYSVRIDGNHFQTVVVATGNPVTAIKVLQQSNATHVVTGWLGVAPENFSDSFKVTVTAFAA